MFFVLNCMFIGMPIALLRSVCPSACMYGSVALFLWRPQVGHIEDVVVDPGYRGKKLGVK